MQIEEPSSIGARFHDLAGQKQKENRQFFQQLKKDRKRNLDEAFQEMHEEVFEDIDCLSCANCCKTTSPRFISKDIDRIARHLRMKPGEFVEQYLHIDEDGDYVLNQAPCPFLGGDNYCSIYEVRPKACREYPHTDQRGQRKILNITYRNTLVCPAVFEMVERMKASCHP